jgi:hypothetical protein
VRDLARLEGEHARRIRFQKRLRSEVQMAVSRAAMKPILLCPATTGEEGAQKCNYWSSCIRLHNIWSTPDASAADHRLFDIRCRAESTVAGSVSTSGRILCLYSRTGSPEYGGASVPQASRGVATCTAPRSLSRPHQKAVFCETNGKSHIWCWREWITELDFIAALLH